MKPLDKIKEILDTLKEDTITPKEIERFLLLVLGTIKKEKESFQNITKEQADKIDESVALIENKANEVTEIIADKLNTTKIDFNNELNSVRGLLQTIREIKATPGKDGKNGKDGIDGKDGTNGTNGLDGKDGVDGQNGLPGADGSSDTRLQIVEKINTGKKEDVKIDVKQVKGMEELAQTNFDRAIGILDQRTQFLINKNTSSGGTWGTIIGTLSDQTDLQSALDAKEDALTFSTGLSRTVNTITSNISTGIAGSQTIYGGTAANEDLTIEGTSNATKTTSYVNLQPTGGNVGIGMTAPAYKLDVTGSINVPEASATNFYRMGGWQALWMDVSNLTNTFIGPSGKLNTTGNNNIAVGQFALTAITSGSNNYAIGNYCARKITTGSQNFVMGGASALGQLVSGVANFAIGNGALALVTTSNNVAIGDSAVPNMTTGSKTVGIGSNVLFNNITGDENCAVGYLACFDILGSHHTSVGTYALRSATSGDSNTAVGHNSGYNSGAAFTGSNCAYFGSETGKNSTSGSNNFIFGHNIGVPVPANSNQLTIGNLIYGTGVDGTGTSVSSGNVGIGIVAPTSRLHVEGSFATAYIEKTANYTLTSADYTVNWTSGTVDATLPTAVGCKGRIYVLKNTGTGIITIKTTSSELIDGIASGVLTLVTNDQLVVQSTNAGWIIIG